MNLQIPSSYRHRNDRTYHFRCGISLFSLDWAFLSDWRLYCVIGLYYYIAELYLGDLRLIYARFRFARLQGLAHPLVRCWVLADI